MEKLYLTCEQVAELLNTSMTTARRVMHACNNSLKAKGYYCINNRVSKKKLLEFMGEVEE